MIRGKPPLGGDGAEGLNGRHSHEPAIDAVARLVPATLKALHALEFAGRHLAPTSLPRLIEAMAGRDDELNAALAASRALDWPERLAPVRELPRARRRSGGPGHRRPAAAADAPQPIVAAYRALRGYAKAAEAIYPMTAFLKPVSQFFLEPSARDDSALLDRLAAIDPAHANVGVMHVGGPPGTRGAFSLYVPEYYDAGDRLAAGRGDAWRQRQWRRLPVELAARGAHARLHRDRADGHRLDLVADGARRRRAQHRPHGRAGRDRWNIDATRQLLTGMSDGGTFSYVLGLRAGCRFTHLAPIAAAFHPMLMSFADADRVRGLPIHIVHGVQDWMFPPELARSAEQTLAAAGADVVYREIADLSHTYPRDENGHILDWFLGRSTR